MPDRRGPGRDRPGQPRPRHPRPARRAAAPELGVAAVAERAEFGLFAAVDHPLAGLERVSERDLSEWRLLRLNTYSETGAAINDGLPSSGGAAGRRPTTCCCWKWPPGFGWAELPRWLVSGYANGRLKELPVSGWPRSQAVDVVWSRQRWDRRPTGCWTACWIATCLSREGPADPVQGEAAGGEEGEFLGAGQATEDRIAMGKAPEAADDLAMLTSVGEEGLAESVVQRYRAILVGKVLGMGERQVEEQPQRVPTWRSRPCPRARSAQRRAWASLAYMRGFHGRRCAGTGRAATAGRDGPRLHRQPGAARWRRQARRGGRARGSAGRNRRSWRTRG